MLEKLKEFIKDKLKQKIEKDFEEDFSYQQEFGETRALALENALKLKEEELEETFKTLENRAEIQKEISKLLWEIKPLQEKANKLKQDLNFAKNYLLGYIQDSQDFKEVEIGEYIYRIENVELVKRDLDKTMIIEEIGENNLKFRGILKETFDSKKFLEQAKEDERKKYSKEYIVSKHILNEENLNEDNNAK